MLATSLYEQSTESKILEALDLVQEVGVSDDVGFNVVALKIRASAAEEQQLDTVNRDLEGRTNIRCA